MQDLAQGIVFGLATGSFLLLATLGFALTRRIEGFLNVAHAELMSIGAFKTWYLNAELGWPFALSAVAAVVATSFAGLLIARIFFEPIRHLSPDILLITSIGVLFILHGVIEAVVGLGIRVYAIPLSGLIEVGGVKITTYKLGVIGVAVVASLGLALFLNRTRTGMRIRAIAINRELAASRGVDTRAASRANWLIVSALAGMAGVALGVLGTLNSDLAFAQILVIIAVAILAGLGSLYSVITAALIVGVTQDVAVTLFLPGGYKPVIAFGVVILVLIFRPSGISGGEAT